MNKPQKKNNDKRKKVWLFLNSAFVICVITLIATELIPYFINKAESNTTKIEAQAAQKKAKAEAQAALEKDKKIKAAEAAAVKAEALKKKEHERVQKLNALRAELNERIKPFVALNNSISQHSTTLIKSAFNGTSTSYTEFKNISLPSLLHQVGELSKDSDELSKAKTLEKQLLNDQNLLINLSNYLAYFTSKGRELLNNSLITEQGYDAAQHKSINTKYVILKKGARKVPLDKNESVPNQKVVSLSQQNRNKLLKLRKSAKAYSDFLQKKTN